MLGGHLVLLPLGLRAGGCRAQGPDDHFLDHRSLVLDSGRGESVPGRDSAAAAMPAAWKVASFGSWPTSARSASTAAKGALGNRGQAEAGRRDPAVGPE